MSRSIALLVAYVTFWLANVPSALAQADLSYLNDTGSPSYSLTAPVENGYIDLSNGNLHLEFPLASPAQRGALKVNERLVYDSRIWMISSFDGNYMWLPENVAGASKTSAGWRLVTGAETGSPNYTFVSETQDLCTGPIDWGYDTVDTSTISYQDPSGTVHPTSAWYQQEFNDCYDSATQYTSGGVATDGSGYRIIGDQDGNPIVTDNTGMQVYPQVIDRYGNYTSYDANGNLIDGTGRIPVIATTTGNVTTYDVLAPNGTNYPNEPGLRVRYTVTTASTWVTEDFQPQSQSGISSWSGYLDPVQSIQLPDGSQYTFGYDGDSELTNITLPTGGTIVYQYANWVDSTNTENRWLSSRRLGSNGPVTTYNRGITNTCTNYASGCVEWVSVDKPSGDETLYQLTLANGAWNTQTTVYTGGAGGTGLGQEMQYTSNQNVYTNATCDQFLCRGGNYLQSQSSTTDVFPDVSNPPSGSGLWTETYTEFNTASGKPTKVKTWDFDTPTGAPPATETDYSYTGNDLYQVTVFDSSGQQASQTTYGYTSNATATSGVTQHGTQNAGGPYLQTVSRWNNLPGGNPSVTTYTMDDTGEITKVVDPDQHPGTTISYQCNNSLPYQVANPLGQTTTYNYDCSSGAIVSVQDPNDTLAGRPGTTYQYESAAGRIHSISYPDGGNTTYSYPNATETDATVLATPDPSLTSKAILDSFGRPYQKVQVGSSGSITTQTTYDGNGRVSCVTNPFGTASQPTDGSTCVSAYDGLDRTLTETLPDGSTRTWSYSNNVTTATDEAGVRWQRTYSVFGRLTQVIELGTQTNSLNLESDYGYDGLGNLSRIDQWGGPSGSAGDRVRTFNYDSLGRLEWSYSPEAGYTCYGTTPGSAPATASNCTPSYDANGNLQNKTDSRGVQTGYYYDALNRLTVEGANDGTPINSFGYDYSGLGSSGIGRRFSEFSGGIGFGFYYDPMGRITGKSYLLPSNNGTWQQAFTATYNKAGNLSSLWYADGRLVQQTWDASGNLNTISDGQNTYLSGGTYGPDGAPTSLTFGNGITQAYARNSRLQPVETWVANGTTKYMDKQFCYGPTNDPAAPFCTASTGANNGNIRQVLDALNGNNSQGFSYDALNRVSAFSNGSGTMQQSYTLDPFGNLSQSSGTLQSNLTFNVTSDNRIDSAGYGYDLAGNLTSFNNGAGSSTYAYDAFGDLSNFNSGAATYLYDADRQRVRKDVGNSWTEYLNFGGLPMAEKNSDGSWSDYIYAGNQRIARVDSSDIAIHTHGTSPGGQGVAWSFPGPVHTIVAGDRFFFRQWQSGGNGGPMLSFSDGTISAWDLPDTNGVQMNLWTTQNQWGSRTVDLTPFAGKTISGYNVMSDYSTVGTYDIYYADMAIIAADGTVTPVYFRRLGDSIPNVWNTGQSDLSADEETVTGAAASPSTPVLYYHGDQLGSTRLLTASGGYPISSDTYYPFGQEPSQNADTNHYKYTGLEFDSESYLNHATFRQYASTMGRWMSPDPYSGSMDLRNPQTFNRYTYAVNNPLSFVDPSGLSYCTVGSYFGGYDPSSGTFGVYVDTSSEQSCTAAQGVWMPDPPAQDPNGNGCQAAPGSQCDVTVTTNEPPTWDLGGGIGSSGYIGDTGDTGATASAGAGGGSPAGAGAPNSTPHTAVAGSVAIPVSPGVVADIPFAWVPSTKKVCLGIGGGTGSPGVNVGGVYSFANIENVLSGASVSVAAQSGAVGGQTIHNNSGIAVGNSMGSPGASLTVTYSWCF